MAYRKLSTHKISEWIDIYHNCIIFSVAFSVAIKVFQIFGIFSCVFCASRLREVSISLCVRNCSHALSSYSLLRQASPAGVETSIRSVVSQFLTLAQIERRSRKEEQCLDLYGSLPNPSVSCRNDVISAKNSTVPDTGVSPGIVQFFAEFLQNFCGPSLIAR